MRNSWRESFGTCLICGQPVNAPPTSSSSSTGGLDIDTDGLLLTEECPTRLCLMRFHMLGDRQECHLIDDYTFLEQRRSGVCFRDEFARLEPTVLAANPTAFACFKREVLLVQQGVYAVAVATMRRVAERLTVCACRRCNKAMDRVGAHVDAVYRCSPLTRDSDVGALESNDRDAVAAKKVLQQVALYFEYRPTSTHWTAKSGDRLVRDAALWRCIAHLSVWGQVGGVRSRLVALFHAAHLVYLDDTALLRDAVSLPAWHVHFWRPFYQAHYAPDTFLGMRQDEVARLFDLRGRKDGALWERVLHGRIAAVGDALAVVTHTVAVPRPLAPSVVDERSLLRGRVPQTLAFFRYNFVPPSGGFARQYLRFEAALSSSTLI